MTLNSDKICQVFNKTENENSISVARFRDCGLLKFWFRGVEKFAPWLRKIHCNLWTKT